MVRALHTTSMRAISGRLIDLVSTTVSRKRTFRFDEFAATASTGLKITLSTNADDYVCTSMSSGFKISLQGQTESPLPETGGFYAHTGVRTTVVIAKVKPVLDALKMATCWYAHFRRRSRALITVRVRRIQPVFIIPVAILLR